MNCSTCGNKTKVVDSRTVDATASFKAQARVRELVSWYTPEWVCRRRVCKTCSTDSVTIEIQLDDLEAGWKRRW